MRLPPPHLANGLRGKLFCRSDPRHVDFRELSEVIEKLQQRLMSRSGRPNRLIPLRVEGVRQSRWYLIPAILARRMSRN